MFVLADRTAQRSDRVRSLRHSGIVPAPPKLGMEYVQLTPAPVQGVCHDLIHPRFLLRSCMTETTIGASGCGGPEWLILVFASNMRNEGRLNGRPLREGLTAMSGSHPFEAVLPPMDMTGLAISRDVLAEYCETVEGAGPPAWAYDGIRFFAEPARMARTAGRIRSLMADIDRGLALPPDENGKKAMVWSLLDILVPVIVDDRVEATGDYRLPNRYRIVNRTREYILDRIDEPLQISMVCRDLGISRRALQYSFRDVLNINPVAFMRILRLNGARRDLIGTGAGVQVKDVIDRWGFWHPSRFSGEYKRMFNELPSETLRRRRAFA